MLRRGILVIESEEEYESCKLMISQHEFLVSSMKMTYKMAGFSLIEIDRMMAPIISYTSGMKEEIEEYERTNPAV